MPKLKDSKGVFHKTYRDLYRAEKGYRASSPGTTELEDDEIVDEEIVVTERLPSLGVRSGEVPEPDEGSEEFFCQNCGEEVEKGDAVCESCGLALDWSGLE